jgi:hypothetical protein
VKLYVPIVPIVVNTTEVSVHHPDPHDLEQPYVKLYVPIVPIVVNTTSSGFGKQIPVKHTQFPVFSVYTLMRNQRNHTLTLFTNNR